jgi:hypothetical protein
MATFEMDAFAAGVRPSEEVVAALDALLAHHPHLVDPVVSGSEAADVVRVNAEVEASREVEARERLAAALGEALVSTGVARSWLHLAPGQIAIATAKPGLGLESPLA